MTSLPHCPPTFLEFAAQFPDDDSCELYLAQWRWPDGFICPECGCGEATRLRTRPLWQCAGCRHQTSVTAGTAMHGTRLPLQVWLYALWLVALRKVGISALQLQKETGIGSYKSAWLLLQKVRATLGESEDHKLDRGFVEVDESQVGGRRGRIGRRLGMGGAWLLVAVERIPVTKNGKTYQVSGSARAAVADSTNEKVITDFVVGAVKEGAAVVTDGWSSYAKLEALGYEHAPTPIRNRVAVLDLVLPKVHLLVSNLKTWLNGTFHGITKRYLPKYAAEFLYRFNRRHLGADLFGFFARRVMNSPPRSLRQIQLAAEAWG